MWYFTWILGVLLACAFGIINAMWYEFHTDEYAKSPDDLSSHPEQDDNPLLADNTRNTKDYD